MMLWSSSVGIKGKNSIAKGSILSEFIDQCGNLNLETAPNQLYNIIVSARLCKNSYVGEGHVRHCSVFFILLDENSSVIKRTLIPIIQRFIVYKKARIKAIRCSAKLLIGEGADWNWPAITYSN
jgi:hypothetical protein